MAKFIYVEYEGPDSMDTLINLIVQAHGGNVEETEQSEVESDTEVAEKSERVVGFVPNKVEQDEEEVEDVEEQ